MPTIILFLLLILSISKPSDASFDFISGIGASATTHAVAQIPFKVDDVLTDTRNGWKYKVTSIGNAGNFAPAVFCNMQIQGVPPAGFSTATLQYTFASTGVCSTTLEQNRYYVNVYISKLPPCALVENNTAYYGPDGMQCKMQTVDYLICGYKETDLPDAALCCSNVKKDGLEYVTDRGGACEDIKGNTCPSGQTLFTANGGNWCGLPNNKTEAECEGMGPEWGFPLFWSISSSKCLEISAAMPIYEPPDDSTDLIAGVNDTNKILSDLVNASNANTDGIIRAINTNSDVTNVSNSKIVSAIADSKSAIVAAINAKNFNPTINVESPHVSVSAPSVTVDTSATTSAITSAASQAAQDAAATRASIDGLTVAITGQGPGGPGADMTGVEGRLDAISGKMTGVEGRLDAISGKLSSPVFDSTGVALNGAVDGESAGRIATRYQLFLDRLQGSAVFSSFDGVFSLPDGGGFQSYPIEMGSYGSFEMDFGPFESALNIFGQIAIALSVLLSGRLVIANK